MPEFYNESDHTDYPFISGFNRVHSGGTFDGKGFLDFSLTIGPDTNFLEHTDTVTCTGFNVGASDVIFTFNVENVGLINFVVPLNSPYGFATTAEIILLSKVVATGVLVTADLTYFSGLALGAYTFNTPPVIEPTLVISIKGAFVTELIAANAPRRRPLDCCDEANFGPLPPAPAIEPVFTVDVFPISGDTLILKEGFNCYISLTESNNTLTIGSRLGAGAGEDDGSDPFLVDNWGFQSPTPNKCNDFISSINGVTVVGNVLKILTEGGLTLISDPPLNTITADLSKRGVVCP